MTFRLGGDSLNYEACIKENVTNKEVIGIKILFIKTTKKTKRDLRNTTC